jgi:hypothetical protein
MRISPAQKEPRISLMLISEFLLGRNKRSALRRSSIRPGGTTALSVGRFAATRRNAFRTPLIVPYELADREMLCTRQRHDAGTGRESSLRIHPPNSSLSAAIRYLLGRSHRALSD